MIRDLTSILNAEKIQKQNELLFRSYFEKSPLGLIYITDPTKPISNCNEKICSILGYTKKELLQKNVVELTLQDDVKQDTTTYNNSIQERRTYTYEANKRLLKKDGSEVIAETHGTFIYDDEGLSLIHI